jgi:hypothetical protein
LEELVALVLRLDKVVSAVVEVEEQMHLVPHRSVVTVAVVAVELQDKATQAGRAAEI